MELRKLGPGLVVSRHVSGLWQVADQEREGDRLDVERAARALEAHVEAGGVTTFDAADHYGSAEPIAGALARRREGIRVLTKWVPAPGASSRAEAEAAVDRARRRIGVERVDLLQFHAWNYADPGWLDCLFHLADLKAEGKILHLGVTNMDAVHLDMALRSGIPIVSNQVCYSLLDRRPAGAVTAVCRTHGVQLLAYGTLAGGLLSERWRGRSAPPIDDALTWSQMKYRRFVDRAGGWDRFQELLRTVVRLAARLGVSAANVAARYVLEQPRVAGVVVGARPGERSHLEDNLRLFSFSLDAEARAELDRAADRLDAIPGDCGDEYRRPPYLTAAGDLRHHVTRFPAPYPVRRGDDGRARVSSGTPWEEAAGFSRAIRSGNRIWIAGTTATHGARLIGGDDAAAQTHFAIDKVEGALNSLGAGLSDVVRTRLYVRDAADWEAVARAHERRFREARPANTLVRTGLIGEGYRVEIEAEAEVAEEEWADGAAPRIPRALRGPGGRSVRSSPERSRA